MGLRFLILLLLSCLSHSLINIVLPFSLVIRIPSRPHCIFLRIMFPSFISSLLALFMSFPLSRFQKQFLFSFASFHFITFFYMAFSLIVFGAVYGMQLVHIFTRFPFIIIYHFTLHAHPYTILTYDLISQTISKIVKYYVIVVRDNANI